MILGMSNTYQQLITSLSTSELKWALSKHEDSRVGTNSPFNINHKKSGKLQAWLQWLLLIATSLPVHFLANSVIGPSIYYSTSQDITYRPVDELSSSQLYSYRSSLESGLLYDEAYGDRACWLAFRTGIYTLSQSRAGTYYDDLSNDEYYSYSHRAVAINYTQPCDEYAKKSTLQEMRDNEFNTNLSGNNATLFSVGACGYGRDVACSVTGDSYYDSSYSDSGRSSTEGVAKLMCRLSVRMSAAIILACE